MDNLKILESIDKAIQELKSSSILTETYPDCYTFGNANEKLLSIVIHGNETIGLFILDELLKSFKEQPFSFLIGNRKAVQENKRFFESDLNRSFMTEKKETIEQLQAKNIEVFSKDFKYILDIHQTTCDSETPFCLVRDSEKSNILYKNLKETLLFPVIYLKNQKLSKDGATFSEFASNKNIGFITLELSKAGYSPEMKELGLKIINQFLDIQYFKTTPKKEFEVFTVRKSIEKIQQDDHLVQGLKNFTMSKKNSVIAIQNSTKISLEEDSFILFPKYNQYREFSNELCKLMIKELITF